MRGVRASMVGALLALVALAGFAPGAIAADPPGLSFDPAYGGSGSPGYTGGSGATVTLAKGTLGSGKGSASGHVKIDVVTNSPKGLGGGVTLDVTTDTPAVITLTVSASSSKPKTAAKKPKAKTKPITLRFSARGKQRVKLKFASKVGRRLRRARKVTLKVSGTATYGDASQEPLRRTKTVRAKRRRKR